MLDIINIYNMTPKQYQRIKLIMVFIIAIIFSQMVFYRNYIIPIAVLVAASLFLLLLKRKVKDVLADERDYQTGGKSALLAMQTYSWFAVIIMLILFSQRDLNPAYEPIAMTLAYSTCFLMLLYGLIFRYYDKFKLSDWKLWYSIFAFLLFVIIVIAGARLFSGEDDWICKDGQWVKHGNPSFAAPSEPCR